MNRPYSQQRTPSATCPMERLIVRPTGDRNQPQLQRQVERGWDQPTIRLAFGDCSAIELASNIAVEDAQLAILRAAQTWNAITLPVKYSLSTDGLSDADVVVAWHFTSQDPEAVLNQQTQAHADYPPGNTLFGGLPLPLHFNADFLWGIEESGRYDIETIALHELAHLLGLIYHSGPSTILFGALGPAPLFVQHELDAETIERALRLYE